MIAIRSMRPDFQTDIFWTSSVRSKLAELLSAVAVGGEISIEWAPLILCGREPFYTLSGVFIPPGTTVQRGGVEVK